MGFYNVINPALMQTGQPEDISQVVANLNAIATVLNGGLDNSNMNAAAAIQRSKLDFGAGLVNADIAVAAALAVAKFAPGSAGKVLGSDQTPAAAWVPGMQEIFDSGILGAAQANIDFPNIPQTFKHLLVVANVRSTGAGAQSLFQRINNDSANNYVWTAAIGNSSTVGATGGASSGWRLGNVVAVGTDSQYNTLLCFMPRYTQAVRHSFFCGWGGWTGADAVGMNSGRYVAGAAAITRLTWLIEGGAVNIDTGSSIVVYGIG